MESGVRPRMSNTYSRNRRVRLQRFLMSVCNENSSRTGNSRQKWFDVVMIEKMLVTKPLWLSMYNVKLFKKSIIIKNWNKIWFFLAPWSYYFCFDISLFVWWGTCFTNRSQKSRFGFYSTRKKNVMSFGPTFWSRQKHILLTKCVESVWKVKIYSAQSFIFVKVFIFRDIWKMPNKIIWLLVRQNCHTNIISRFVHIRVIQEMALKTAYNANIRYMNSLKCRKY